MPTMKDLARLWTENRMCKDYKPLNLVTPQDRYPIPIPKKMFDNIGDSNIFTIVDLTQGFITKKFGFCNYQLQLKLSCMRHMTMQLHVTLHMQHVYMVLIYMFIHIYQSSIVAPYVQLFLQLHATNQNMTHV
jgi:hypothetical protein